MRKLAGLFTLMLFVCGCLSTGPRQSTVYKMSYDQTYETVITALDSMPGWRLSSTGQMKGLIAVEAGGYLSPRREVKLIVKRVEPFRTAVELYQGSVFASERKLFDVIERRVREKADTSPS